MKISVPVKFSVDDELIFITYNFAYKGFSFMISVSGSPLEIVRFDDMLTDLGFDKEDKNDL